MLTWSPTIFKSSPSSDNSHCVQELLVVIPRKKQTVMTPRKILMAACGEDAEYEWKWEEGIEIVNIFIIRPPWHTNGDNVGLSLDWVFQFEDRDIVLKGRRLVVLVDHHAFHLNKNISVQIRPGRRNDWSSQSFA